MLDISSFLYLCACLHVSVEAILFVFVYHLLILGFYFYSCNCRIFCLRTVKGTWTTMATVLPQGLHASSIRYVNCNSLKKFGLKRLPQDICIDSKKGSEFERNIKRLQH